MAAFTEIIFFLAFIVGIAITIYKIYNILSGWSIYEWKEGILLFIVYLMTWGIMFFMNIIEFNNTAIRVIFSFGNMFFLLNTLFLLIEVIKTIIKHGESSQRKRYDNKGFTD